MGEIVHLQVGQCGNQIGAKFWESICQEHGLNQAGLYTGINKNQLKQINVYFNQSSGGKYVPRAILADLEPGTMDSIRAGSFGGLYRPDNCVFGQTGAGNNYAKGYYTEGAEIVDAVMNVTRKEAEACDNLQGFQLMHSLGGGSGSGLGSLLINKIKEEYPDRVMTTYSVMPSPKVSDTVVEPYNAVLSMNHLINQVDQCFVLDNDALFDICRLKLKLATPTFGDLNALITAATTGATSSFRFPSPVNGDMLSFQNNMIPFMTRGTLCHFFLMGYAPLASLRSLDTRVLSVADLTKEMFDVNNIMCAADPRKGKYLACSMMFRGPMSNNEVGAAVHSMAEQNSGKFVEWDQDNIKATICDIPPALSKTSGMFIANTTCITTVFHRILNQFQTLLDRKAFTHWYTGEGMDEDEFNIAQNTLNDLISEYQNYEMAKSADDMGEY